MAKAKFMNGEFSAKFKGKRRFVAEQMEAIKDYAARDDMQINICPVIQERPSGKRILRSRSHQPISSAETWNTQ